MADASITFSTALDNKQLEKDLRDAKRDVDSLKKKLEGQEFEQSWLEKLMKRATERIDEAKARVDELSKKAASLEAEWKSIDASSGNPAEKARKDAVYEELRSAQRKLELASSELDRRLGEWEGYDKKWDVVNAKVKTYEEALAAAETRQHALGEQLASTTEKAAPAWQRAGEAIRSRFSSIAEGIRSKMAEAANKSVSPWEQFAKRVGTMVKQVFAFSLMVKGLNAIKNAIGSMLMQNAQFSASVENLKAVFNGFLAQIVSAVLPGLTALVNTIAAVFTRIAGIIDTFFGTNIVGAIQGQRNAASAATQSANAQKAARAEEQQAKSAGKLAKAQEKANRQLMAFDEINAMAAESSEDAADAATDYADAIDSPEYETDWTTGDFGQFGMLQGVLDWLDELRDRILNDMEGPFARIREGLERIAEGWRKVVEGFQTGDLGLVWEGITDIVVGACYVIEGAFTALMDWLDEQTGGRFTNIFQGLSNIVSGFVKVVEGVLTGDLGLVIEGVCQMFAGLHQTIVGLIEGFRIVFDDLMVWLNRQTGGRFREIFDGLRLYVSGLCDFLIGLMTLDMPRAFNGLMDMIEGATLLMKGVLNAIADAVKAGVSWLFDYLSERFPKLEGFFQSTKKMICEIIDNVRNFLRSVLDGTYQMMKGTLDLIVGVFTLDGQRILQGIEGIANGIRSVVDGMANSVRGIVGSVFDWLESGITGIFDFLSEKFPAAAKLFEGLKRTILAILGTIRSTVLGVISGIQTTLSGAIRGAQQIIEGGLQVIAGVFTLNGDRIIYGLKSIVNGFISVVESICNGAITGVVGFANGVISGLSQIPGIYIPPITFYGVSLPRLAQGAVIPPNREFMAVLGDQKHGTNIEAPESLMRQVVREETGPLLADMVAAIINANVGASSGNGRDIVLMVGRRELARETVRGVRELQATGEVGDLVFA